MSALVLAVLLSSGCYQTIPGFPDGVPGGGGGSAGEGGSAGGPGSGGVAGSRAGAGGSVGAGGGVGGGGAAGGGGSAAFCVGGEIDVHGDGTTCRCDCQTDCGAASCGCSAPLLFASEDGSGDMDCLTPDVCLMRLSDGLIINAARESQHDELTSPIGTLWAAINCEEAQPEDFSTFSEVFSPAPENVLLDTPLCLMLEGSNLKYDVTFSSWDVGAAGNGFRYSRIPFFADECGHVEAICGETCGCPQGYVVDVDTGACREDV